MCERDEGAYSLLHNVAVQLCFPHHHCQTSVKRERCSPPYHAHKNLLQSAFCITGTMSHSSLLVRQSTYCTCTEQLEVRLQSLSYNRPHMGLYLFCKQKQIYTALQIQFNTISPRHVTTMALSQRGGCGQKPVQGAINLVKVIE